MKTVSLAEAKSHLSALIDCVEDGDTISITRRGKPVAQIVKAERKRKPIDVARLRALTADMTPQTESAGAFMRRLRESDRY